MDIILWYFKQLSFNMGMKIPFTGYIVMFTFIDYPFFKDIRRLPVKNLNNCYTT